MGRGRRGDPPRQRPYAIPDDRSEDQTLGPRNGALDVKRLHQANSAVIKLAKNIRPLLRSERGVWGLVVGAGWELGP